MSFHNDPSTTSSKGRHRSRSIAFLLTSLMVGAVFVAAAPSAGAVLNYGEYGSFVDNVSDQDFVASLTEPGTADICIGYVDDPNNPTDDSKRAWFIHIDSDGGCDDNSVLSSQSFRITQFGGTTSAQWMTSSDTTYVGKSFALLEDLDSNNNVCFLEADGLSGYSTGDPVYYDADGDDDISANDLRLASVSSSDLAALSTSVGIVDSSDTDLTRAEDGTDDPTRLPIDNDFTGNSGGCGTFDAKALNLGSQGTFDDDDLYYLTHSNLPTANFGAQGILRLTSGNSLTAGQKVANGNNDHQDFLQTPVANDGSDSDGDCDNTCTIVLRRTNPSESNVAAQNLFIHMPNPGASDGDILVNDVLIRQGQTSAGSAGNPGTLVSSTSNGASEEIQDATAYSVEDLLFFVDIDGDGTWDPEDSTPEPVYMKHPSNSVLGSDDAGCHGGSPTGTQRCLEVNDLRVWVDGQTAGTLVEAGDSDHNAWQDNNGQTGADVRLFSEKLDTRTPLTAVSNGKYWDKDSDGIWDPANEDVFIGAMTNDSDATTYKRVWTGGAADNTGVTCPALGNPCGGSNLKTTSNVRTTGPDSTYDETAEGEYVYWSEDQHLTVGDYRLGAVGGSLAGGVVGTGDAALGDTLFQSSGTTLYASFAAGASFPTSRDIEIHPNFGTRLTSTSTEVVPDLTQLTISGAGSEIEIVRVNLGTSSSFNDDVYLLDFSDGSCSAAQTLRLTPYENAAAGTFLTDQDTVLLNGCQNAAAGDTESDPVNAFGYLEVGTTSGFSPDDFIYFNNVDVGGTAGTTLSTFDARITEVAFSGNTYEAGTFVVTADSDHQSFGGDAFTSTTFGMFHYDANRNGIVDEDDMVYLRQGSDATLVPTFLDLRMLGSGGATSSTGGSSGGGGGGGGGGTPTTTPASVSINSPSNGAYVETGSSVSISGTASAGTGSGLSVSLTVDGDTVSVTGTTSWSATFTPDSDGQYTISATAQSSSGSGSASVTINANAEGEAPDADDDGVLDGNDECPNQAGPASNNGCPEEGAGDQQARQDAAEAKQTAEEAKQAAESAEQTAKEAKTSAEGARNASEANSEGLESILEAVRERDDTDDTPGPGALGALVAVGLALIAARRQRR